GKRLGHGGHTRPFSLSRARSRAEHDSRLGVPTAEGGVSDLSRLHRLNCAIRSMGPTRAELTLSFCPLSTALTKGHSPFAGATRAPLLHLQFTLDRKYLMPSHFAVAPEAQIHACLPHTELVKRDLRQPAWKQGIDVELVLVGIRV